MFGHDNNQDDQDNHDDNQGGVTLPAVDGAASTSDTTVSPTSAPLTPDATAADTTAPPLSPPDLSSAPAAPIEPALGSPATDDLLDIKQDALQSLSPLIDHLDQTPEEKFRTTMMMIQASDNHALIKPAYEAAKAITDEKERAQALLDIVNEINYFTQHTAAPTE